MIMAEKEAKPAEGKEGKKSAAGWGGDAKGKFGEKGKPVPKSARRFDTTSVVRIAGRDLDGSVPMKDALRDIKGVSHRMAAMVAASFVKVENLPYDTELAKLSEGQQRKLEDVLAHPGNYGIPVWAVNRRKDFDSGENKHLIMADWDFMLRKDVLRLNEIKSYRGLRHAWGLTVRGQRTKSTHRGKGGVVGVMKKEARIAAAKAGAPAEKAAPAKKEQKK